MQPFLGLSESAREVRELGSRAHRCLFASGDAEAFTGIWLAAFRDKWGRTVPAVRHAHAVHVRPCPSP